MSQGDRGSPSRGQVTQGSSCSAPRARPRAITLRVLGSRSKLCNQQSLGAEETLLFWLFLSTSWMGSNTFAGASRSIKQHLRSHGNPLAGPLSSLTVLWGFLGAEIALVSQFCSSDGAFCCIFPWHPKQRPRKQVTGERGF